MRFEYPVSEVTGIAALREKIGKEDGGATDKSA
jgi:hypothetical protein